MNSFGVQVPCGSGRDLFLFLLAQTLSSVSPFFYCASHTLVVAEPSLSHSPRLRSFL